MILSWSKGNEDREVSVSTHSLGIFLTNRLLAFMKKLLFASFLFVATVSYSQEITIFVLVRHAEKVDDGTQNPPLTAAGDRRANKLLDLFISADISAIYSTEYKRTQRTISPLANAKNLKILSYDWEDPKGLLATMLEKHAGGIVVISGHSNTTPIVANILLGEEKLAQFDDGDYGNILIVTIMALGQGRLTHLRF